MPFVVVMIPRVVKGAPSARQVKILMVCTHEVTVDHLEKNLELTKVNKVYAERQHIEDWGYPTD